MSHISIIMLLIMVFFMPLSAHATTEYCGNYSVQNFIRLTAANLDRVNLDQAVSAQAKTIRRELNSAWVFNREKQHTSSIGFNFRYTIMDLDSIDAMTNGHLHTWDFPFDGLLVNTDSAFYYHLSPALSVSSNVLKNPKLTSSDSFQLSTGLVYKKNFSPMGDWLLGIRSDHRFGPYKAYPVIGLCLQPGSDWILQLALPDFSISKVLSGGISLKLFAKPVGNLWDVFSKDKTQHSDFIYNATAIGLSAQWRFSDSMNVSLDIESQTNRQFSFVLNDNTLVESNAGSSMGLILTGEVLF